MTDTLTQTMTWTSFGGHQLLHADYRALESDKIAIAIKENQTAIEELGRQGHKDLLVLTDVTDTEVDHVVVTAFMQVASAMRPFTRASAVVGMGMARTVMLKVVNSFSAVETHPADSIDEAKRWLVSQASN